MDWQEAFNDLELDEDAVTNDDVESVTTIHAHALVLDWKRSLALEREPTVRKLGAHARLICRLQQSWTKRAMDLDQRADDGLGTVLKPSALPPFLFHLQAIGRQSVKLRDCRCGLVRWLRR